MFSFDEDEYVRMEGNWTLAWGSSQYHANFLKGKRHCSLAENCFGVIIGATDWNAYSINFPIRLKAGGTWYINKKESTSGSFIYQECVFVINL